MSLEILKPADISGRESLQQPQDSISATNISTVILDAFGYPITLKSKYQGHLRRALISPQMHATPRDNASYMHNNIYALIFLDCLNRSYITEAASTMPVTHF